MREAYASKIHGHNCRMCGSWGVELHHLIPRSRWGRIKRLMQDHPDNCIPLCHTCHQHHHTTGHRRVLRKVLRAEEVQFLSEHIHPSWIDSWYPEEDNDETSVQG